MRSFAVVAGFAAAANAYAYGYPEGYSTTSSAASYETSSAPAYPAYPAESSSAPAYPAYPESSKAPEYPAYPAESSSAPAYPAYPESSKAPEYPAYPVESSSAIVYPVYSTPAPYTTVYPVTGVSTVCDEATTLTYGTKTYTVSSSTTLIDEDCEYTTSIVVTPTPTPIYTTSVPAGKPTYSEYVPVHSSVPAGPGPYPSAGNGTTAYPTGYKPSATKPATPEFTGAAAQAGVGLLAVVGAVAAFL